MGINRVQMKGKPKIFVMPWQLYSAQYKLFFSSPYTVSIPLSPSTSKLGRQPCWVACLLVYVSVQNSTLSLICKNLLKYFIWKKVCLGKRCYPEHVLYLLVPSRLNDITLLVMITIACTVLLVMLMACKPTDCSSGYRMRCGVTI
jgi:hypothetical protein